MDYVCYDGTGEIQAWYSMPEGELPIAPDGTTLLQATGKRETHYVSNGQVTLYTPEEGARKASTPSYPATWSNSTKTWTDLRSLAELKAAKLLEINQGRATANMGQFTYLGKQIACDRLSRSDIDAVNGELALTGTFPAGWPGGWKCVDNTYVVIADKATWVAFYQAMTAQGTSNFLYAQSLKQQVVLATTATEIENITWV